MTFLSKKLKRKCYCNSLYLFSKYKVLKVIMIFIEGLNNTIENWCIQSWSKFREISNQPSISVGHLSLDLRLCKTLYKQIYPSLIHTWLTEICGNFKIIILHEIMSCNRRISSEYYFLIKSNWIWIREQDLARNNEPCKTQWLLILCIQTFLMFIQSLICS